MDEMFALLWAGLAGMVLGTMFYGGLWWTIRKSLASARPATWVFASLLTRMGIALVGFHFVAGSHWERLVMCLLGFMVARGGVTWMTRAQKVTVASRDIHHEANHAP